MTRMVSAGPVALALLLGAATPASAQQPRFDVTEATIASVHAEFDAGRLTCRALVQSYLDRIAAYDKRGPSLNAIQTVHPRALAIADSLDAARRSGAERGPLHCVPVLVKDQIETRAMRTTYGSSLFKDFVPQRDATVVTRLEAAGAIILAKATMASSRSATWAPAPASSAMRTIRGGIPAAPQVARRPAWPQTSAGRHR
jgi:amidase